MEGACIIQTETNEVKWRARSTADGVLSRREGTLGMDSSRDRGEDLRVDNTTTLPAAQDGRNKAIPF